ncbi:MAG: glutamyl-tRNA reductase [Neisseriaceae bacterium]|nr:glutamyl-tRNA reductase [Neisseriaceae bacterium]
MQLSVIGLNHQTAPVSIRERLAFAAQVLPDALQQMVKERVANEAAILSTCNRTEIYCVAKPEHVIQWLAKYHHIPEADIRPYLYTLDSEKTIRHAFRVSCGLDSMVLGEPQILGQIKDAVRIAQEQNTIETTLNTLFQRTFAVAKEVRSTTAVGESSVSMAAASVKMAERIFPDIADLNVLFVGAGEMIELVATYFAAKNPKHMMVANRTLKRAEELCQIIGQNAQACVLNDLPDILSRYDVVVSSTASPLPIIGKGMVERALKGRRKNPMFLLDLAVPLDIEREVGDLSDAFLYTVDDIASIVEIGKEARQQAASEAESIIDERVHDFLAWQETRKNVPLIVSLKDEGERARRYVLANAIKQLNKGMSPEDVLERLSVQLTNKLLHAPTRALSQAQIQDNETVEAIAQVYHLRND